MPNPIRIAFAGVPGSGKTSTARALAGLCGTEIGIKRVELVHEYARTHIAEYGSIDTLADQFAVSMRQIDWEDRATLAIVDAMVTDCPIHLGWLYAMYIKQKTKKDAMYASDLFTKLIELNVPPRYDFVFHLPPIEGDFEDGVRKGEHLDEDWRLEADNLVPFIFKLFPPRVFKTVKAVPLLDRVRECLDYIRTNV